jgi:hypothetical protein
MLRPCDRRERKAALAFFKQAKSADLSHEWLELERQKLEPRRPRWTSDPRSRRPSKSFVTVMATDLERIQSIIAECRDDPALFNEVVLGRRLWSN